MNSTTMRRSTRGVAAMLAGMMLLGSMAMGAPAIAAEERPDVSSGSWTDCGPNYCTEYYSRERTEALLESVEDLRDTEVNVAIVEIVSLLSMRLKLWKTGAAEGGSLVATNAVYDKLEDFRNLLDDAVDKGACLQHRVDEDGEHLSHWDYTGHSEYCFSQ